MDLNEKIRLLLVEDDEDLSWTTSAQLKKRGYDCFCVMTGEEALQTVKEYQPDLVLLDIMLPDYEGHDLCRMFRSEEYEFFGPVIFMSCLGDSSNIVKAFREGGCDYMVKPVDMDELQERIEINLKNFREAAPKTGKRIYRQFIVDEKKHAVMRNKEGREGEKIELSPIEYKLLIAFINCPDEVLLYRQLYKQVWEQDDIGDYRPLMVHVSNLRKKIDWEHREVIRAVRGAGYLFQDV